MALRATCARLAVKAVKDSKAYEAIKVSAAPVMVGFYTAHFSAASKMYAKHFETLADSYPSYAFYTCDVDDAPLAAYDSEITDVPSVAIQPLGYKPDGSHFDKTDLVVVAPELANYSEVIAKAKQTLDAIQVLDKPASERKPWEFDPATGTTMAPHQ
eukprot:NODE_25490_length_585_cov_3.482533.p2 GENE.NODE_25490_length_585_cov_3.482533~~NODE_25490_length_585_cov_3.482533.p2  ORF type:complete len:157 (-),score=45.39 NODE_25490_length_585_cov_3.482533:44-514(-)